MAETKAISAPVINLIDESFDEKKSNTYHLSILVNEDYYAFTVLDKDTNKYLVLQRTSSIEDFLKIHSEGNNMAWASVTCAIAHSKFTLVPSALFDEENKKELFGFNHPVGNEEKIHSDTLRSIETKNLFTISRSIESEVRKYFINVHFIHNATSLIEGVLIHNKNNIEKKVFANFHNSYFEIVIIDGRELQFSNAFTYTTPEVIAYYILFVYEQLRLNPEEVALILSGEIEKNSKEHSLLYNYIRNVKFATLPDGFKYSYKFNEIQSHQFWTLFTQYFCVT